MIENYSLLHLIPLILALSINIKYIFNIFKTVLKLNIFILFLALFLILFHEEFNKALFIIYRFNLIVIFVISLYFNKSAYDIVKALHFLKSPNKLTVVCYFSVQYIDFLLHQLSKLQQKLKARGFKPSFSLFTYKTYGYLIGFLILDSIKKAEITSQMLKARDFKGKIFFIDEKKVEKKEFIIFITVIMTVIGGIFWS